MIAVKEAKRLEDSFLGGITEAQDAYEQIVANEAWTALGYETHTEWWRDRVAPLMRQISMFPNKKLRGRVLEEIEKDEADLPPAQRMRQQEKAELVGASEATIGREEGTRSTPATNVATADLEPPIDPLPTEVADEIERKIAEKSQPEPIQLADPEVRERLAREREEQQMRELHSGQLAKSVWLLAQYGAEADAAHKFVKDWQPSQDIYPQKTTAVRLRAAGDFLYALAERWPQ